MNPIEAPGKVFLAGEYAVLDPGRPALVAAVDLKLQAVWETAPRLRLIHRPSGASWESGAPPDELRFAVRAVQMASRFCGGEPGMRLVFDNDMASRHVKLGLGGSAAASVIAVRAACAAAGREISEDQVISLALASHWVESGGSGSGGDVAACALGGLLEVRSRIGWKSPEDVMALPPQQVAEARPLEVRRVKFPPEMRLLLAFTGRAADTRGLIAAVKAFSAGQRGLWRARAVDIATASEALRDALESGDQTAALDAIRRGAAAMAALGEQAKVPIATPELLHACALAAFAGAAGKPSGSGGGDCAVILAFGDESRDRAEATLKPYFPVFRVAPT